MASFEFLRMRLVELDSIEHDISEALHLAGLTLCELGKEKTAAEVVERNIQNFSKKMSGMEEKLSRQIVYLIRVSTVQPHEGSNYAAAKNLHMALHRRGHVQGRIKELQQLKEKHQGIKEKAVESLREPV